MLDLKFQRVDFVKLLKLANNLTDLWVYHFSLFNIFTIFRQSWQLNFFISLKIGLLCAQLVPHEVLFVLANPPCYLLWIIMLCFLTWFEIKFLEIIVLLFKKLRDQMLLLQESAFGFFVHFEPTGEDLTHRLQWQFDLVLCLFLASQGIIPGDLV